MIGFLLSIACGFLIGKEVVSLPIEIWKKALIFVGGSFFLALSSAIVSMFALFSFAVLNVWSIMLGGVFGIAYEIAIGRKDKGRE